MSRWRWRTGPGKPGASSVSSTATWPAARWRREGVEAPGDGALLGLVGRGVQPAQVVGEAAARRVQVQETRLAGALVAERVDHFGRDDDQAAGLEGERGAACELEPQAALEHVEAVGVPAVDVRSRAALSGGVARLGRAEPFVLREDADDVLGAVTDHLAFPASDQDRLHARDYARPRGEAAAVRRRGLAASVPCLVAVGQRWSSAALDLDEPVPARGQARDERRERHGDEG